MSAKVLGPPSVYVHNTAPTVMVCMVPSPVLKFDMVMLFVRNRVSLPETLMSTQPPFPPPPNDPYQGQVPGTPQQPENQQPPAFPPPQQPPYTTPQNPQQYPPQQYSQQLPPYGYSPFAQPNQGLGTGAKVAIGIGIGCIALFVLGMVFSFVILTIVGHQVNDVFSNISNNLYVPMPT